MKQAKITYEALGDTLLIHMPKELDHHNCRDLKRDTDLMLDENYINRIIFLIMMP
jgi:stage II sporulation protein AA (anti-sigma F factor antagonist)